jgi:hypothetical protein
MNDVLRLLVLLVVAGAAVTLVSGLAIRASDEGRQVRRGLRIMLKGDTHGLLVARGRGRGMGLNFTNYLVAVAWDRGAWGLVYRLDELMGAEAIVDDQVVARVHRGEARRASDVMGGATQRVALRLIFNDVSHPDFLLDLWLPQDEGRRDALTPAEAVEEANRWLARLEALFRQPQAPPAAQTPSAPPSPPPSPAAPPPERPAAAAPAGPLFDRDDDVGDHDEDEDEDGEDHR